MGLRFLTAGILVAILNIGAGIAYSQEEETKQEKASSAQNETGMEPDYLRTKTEWMGCDWGIGVYGAMKSISLFTWRWKHFYYTLITTNVTLGIRDNNFNLFFHGGFFRFGVPLHFDASGKHEIRLGLSIELPIGVHTMTPINCGDVSDDAKEPKECPVGKQFKTIFVVPEVSYHFHVNHRFSLRTGVRSHFSTLADFWHFDHEYYPLPHVVIFAGFAL